MTPFDSRTVLRPALAAALCLMGGSAAAATCGGAPRLAVTTPTGFCAGIIGQGFKFARGVQPMLDGSVLVVDLGGWQKNQGSVWLLKPGAGGFQKTLLMKKIDRPNGIVLGPDGLVYVGAIKRVFRFDPRDPEGSSKDVIGGNSGTPGLPGIGRHPLTAMRFDAKGDLYVNVGSGSDHCEDKNGKAPDPAKPCLEASGANALGVLRKYTMQWPAGTVKSWEVHATGLRNSMALAVHPTTQAVWQGENSRDAIQVAMKGLKNDNDLPHDELNLIEAKANYGWPYCYDNNVASPEYPDAKCAAYRAPVRLLPAHAAPLGMTFYTGDMFPAQYKNSLIVGYHGYRAHGRRLVAFLPDAQGAPLGKMIELISDWGAKPNQAPGAPVDVKQGPDGAIYVVEDHSGRVLRLQYAFPVPDPAKSAPGK
ncbi:glucose dehydrogenase [Massilia sp. CCM 8733]|uniref:Glucose dehydrogenase n=1 Tax=Massilia mucilaginosa TaxID=2609282 RepID=A0ABX0NT32_9BURK|nr:PQQ-dependent sugar dehydrogenase [Massilia mucilaginosa]NHZ90007.1 glucose dehydrogenase [Massilia mucilaginosa]